MRQVEILHKITNSQKHTNRFDIYRERVEKQMMLERVTLGRSR